MSVELTLENDELNIIHDTESKLPLEASLRVANSHNVLYEMTREQTLRIYMWWLQLIGSLK